MPDGVFDSDSPKGIVYQKVLDLLQVRPGASLRLLDFGCGTGELVGHISRWADSGSYLVGIDAKAAFIEGAKAAFPQVQFICDRFRRRLPLPDGTLDAVVTIDTVECIPDKRALIHEMHRVLRPGGEVVAVHWDWDTQVYCTQEPGLAGRAAWLYANWQQPWMDAADPQMGRKLWGLFEGSGLFRGRSEAVTLVETEYERGSYGFDNMQRIEPLVAQGHMDREEYDRLLRQLQEDYAERRYLYSLTAYVYFGVKE